MGRKKIPTRSAGRIGKEIGDLIGYVPTKRRKFDVDAKPTGRGGRSGRPDGSDGPHPGGTTTPGNGSAGSKTDYSRPSGFRKGVRDKVWNDSVEPRTGRVRDPVTGQFMSKKKPWDMGHKPGQEHRKHAADAERRGISRDDYLNEHNDPNRYRPELPSSNRSHKGEDKTDNYAG